MFTLICTLTASILLTEIETRELHQATTDTEVEAVASDLCELRGLEFEAGEL